MKTIQQLNEYAQKMRDKPTAEEAKAMELMKENGIDYIHQYVVQPYIADFLIPSHNIIVEINGGYHNTEKQRSYDFRRYKDLAAKGYVFISCKNEKLELLIPRIKRRMATFKMKSGKTFLSFDLGIRIGVERIKELDAKGEIKWSGRYRDATGEDRLKRFVEDVYRSKGVRL